MLSPPVANSNEPQIAVGPNGDALVVWYQAAVEDGELMVFASERHRVDGEFNRPGADAFLSPAGADARNPVPAVGARGHAAVVWTQGSGDIVPIYLATRDGLRNWTLPAGLDRPFSAAHGQAAFARVVFGRDTDLFVVWSQDLGAGPQVWAAHRDGMGEWDEPGHAPTLLSTPEHRASYPSLASGPHGEAIVAWSECAAGCRIAARRRNAGATGWSELDVLSPDDGNDAQHPVVAIAPTGRAVVAWEQGPSGDARIRFATMQ